MKQSSLDFGGRKKISESKKIRECSGHADLRQIRFCKACFTIYSLRLKCANTKNATTGQPLGIWGTKEQMLQRLLKNSAKQQMSKGSEMRQPELQQPQKINAGACKYTSLFAILLFCLYLIVCMYFFHAS